jgi:hypothetical protein
MKAAWDKDRAWYKALMERVRTHLEELAEAWRRGALTEHDGGGGTRSNRNWELVVELVGLQAPAAAKEVKP